MLRCVVLLCSEGYDSGHFDGSGGGGSGNYTIGASDTVVTILMKI